MLPHRCNKIKAIIRAARVALGQLIMTWLADADPSMMKLEKLRTDVSFTNLLNSLPQRHCDKKTSIETWEQSVIVMSQLLVASSCIDDVTKGQQLFTFLKSSGGVTEHNVDLRQVSIRNHTNDQYTEYTEPEIFGRCYEMDAKHLDFRGDIIRNNDIGSNI